MGYLSHIILEAKFGAPTGISEAKFEAKPPDLLIRKYPPGVKTNAFVKGLKIRVCNYVLTILATYMETRLYIQYSVIPDS